MAACDKEWTNGGDSSSLAEYPKGVETTPATTTEAGSEETSAKVATQRQQRP